jgi:outer membrane protein TolC
VFLDQASQTNARLAQAQAGRDLAEAGADLAASRMKPSVYAFGTYNLNPDDALPTEPDWAVGIGARYTLISTVDRRRMLGAARAHASAAAEVERQARDDARLLVTRAYNQAELARRQFLSMDSSLQAASENLRVQEVGFREGEATATSVVDARNLLGGARLQRAAAAYEYDLSLAALLAASGSDLTLNDYLQREDRISAP